MDDLKNLRLSLGRVNDSVLARPSFVVDFQSTLRNLRSRVNSSGSTQEPKDRVIEAVNKFWTSPGVSELQQARYVTFGMSIKSQTEDLAIFDDSKQVIKLLDREHGIGQWESKPSWYRRVIQGLVVSYFHLDPYSSSCSITQKSNWLRVRDYLAKNINKASSTSDPDWLKCCLEHPSLFTDSPGDDINQGEGSLESNEFKNLLELIRANESWLPRELILSKLRKESAGSDVSFLKQIRSLIQIISGQKTIIDRALTILLNRYAKIENPIVNHELKEFIVSRWDNPWLAGAAKKWPVEVSTQGRNLISDWLKSEFIEAFFTKMAEDGETDRRRLDFWMKYRKSMSYVYFGLGNNAMYSTDPDMTFLKKKMNGLISSIRSTKVNAFIMVFGDVIAVEFSSLGNALYLYRSASGMPFDLSRPLNLNVDGTNSLKRSVGDKYSHQDGSHGFNTWEAMFSAELYQKYSLLKDGSKGNSIPIPTLRDSKVVQRSPSSSSLNADSTKSNLSRFDDPVIPVLIGSRPSQYSGFTVVSGKTSWAELLKQPFSEQLLRSTCQAFAFPIEDNRADGGALWVKTANSNSERNRVFVKWGFKYRPERGWWKN